MNCEKIDDENIADILNVIQKIASGDLSARVKISDNQNIFDAIAAGINMLGEEIEANSIEKEDQEKALLNMLADVKEAKEMLEISQEAVRKNVLKYQGLINNLSDVVMEIDSEGNFSYISPQIEEIYGFKPEELLHESAFKVIHPDDIELAMDKMAETIAGGRIINFEFRTLHKNGNYRYVSAAAKLTEKGKNGKIVSVVRDITEKKQMENELQKYTQHLEEEVKQRTNELIQSEKMASLGQLVAGVAHEINNPLGFITLNNDHIKDQIEELIEASKDEKITQTLQDIEKLLNTNTDGVERIANITKTLKRYAIPNCGDKTPADINQGLKDTLVILFNQLKHRIKIHTNYGDLPDIKCNLGQLNQVFMNLFINASQAMDKGKIWVKTWHDEKNAYIEIKDDGSGIDEKVVNRIFDPFFTTKKTGTGLGLSLCYRIIKDHNGDIKVKSKVGSGTKMLIKIPKEV